MFLAMLIFLYLVILGLELPFLWRKRLYKEMAVFLAFFFIGVYLSLAKFKGYLTYNPLEPLIYFYKLKI